MKIRNGFVSNSSSSSFVVAFPENPRDAEHVREMMFGDITQLEYPYDIYDNRQPPVYTTQDIAGTVFHDIQSQKVNNKKNIIEGFQGWLEGAPDSPDVWRRDDLSEDEKAKAWNDWNKEFDAYVKDTALTFMKARKNMYIYVFEYSDNDGEYGSMLEHGNIFKNLDHRRISRH